MILKSISITQIITKPIKKGELTGQTQYIFLPHRLNFEINTECG